MRRRKPSSERRFPYAQRVRIEEIPPAFRYDLDSMSPEALRAFVDSAPRVSPNYVLYPLDPMPLGSYRAARGLIYLALYKLRWGYIPIREYKKLPAWAQWRSAYNPAACVEDGKNFRRRPPKTKIDLLGEKP